MPRTKAPPTPCTAETKRCETSTNYRVATPECCLDHQRAIMRHVAEVFREAGVRWWADYGTLLGAVRNPLLGLPAGIIPHDKDGDLGVLGEDWETLLEIRPDVPWVEETSRGGKPNRVRMLDGFEWIHKLERNRHTYGAGWSIKVRRSAKNHNNVDIFPWFRRDDGTRFRHRYVGCDRYKGREFPEEKLLPFGEVEWEDMRIPAPADPEWFLVHRYGDGWQKPLKRNNDGKRR